MTVMHSGCDVADKAVSTEDTSEAVHLDAILAALMENKVEAMKAASSVLTAPSKGKWSSVLISPGHSRLTSSSTASSSQNHHRHRRDKHHQHSNKKEHYYNSSYRQRHRHRRYDSAPCENFIEEHSGYNHQKHLRGHRRASEKNRTTKYKRHYSRSTHVLSEDTYIDLNLPMELIGPDHDLAFINVERPSGALSDNGEYPGLDQSASLSHTAAHLRIVDDDDDYLALNITDELDMDSLNCPDLSIGDSLEEHYRSPRRKRKRKRKVITDNIIMTDIPEVMLVDHDELPPRARWTIVATACLLFAMSILLVGVTLRMAPIIDDMVINNFMTKMEDDSIPLIWGKPEPLPGREHQTPHVYIGDDGFKLEPFLMRPFSNDVASQDERKL
ncbi:hypothetical protein PV328_011752 [Microctonus aethiopoides]|uniref:Uncharacterized protein n=1 Tax=Microctonus aethiopoides TaxID=144406 RepID=A0AA39FHL3_9HYME|nr:hypothetical protein PV328_011752 [Microctonus aethiopoides]